MAGNYKHGGAHTRLYNIWKSMRQRCINPKNSRYSVYGAKGIKVCKEWDDFKKFRDWAIKNGYEKKLTIDRIDNSKGYSPKNCRWVSYKIQANNKTNNRFVTYRGETHTLGEWSEITGIKLATIWARLNKGWSTEDALTVNPNHSNVAHKKAG